MEMHRGGDITTTLLDTITIRTLFDWQAEPHDHTTLRSKNTSLEDFFGVYSIKIFKSDRVEKAQPGQNPREIITLTVSLGKQHKTNKRVSMLHV